MNQYTFLYKAKFCTGFTDNQVTYGQEAGILYAKDFTEAVSYLEDFYGTNLESVEITTYSGCSFLRFPVDQYEEVFKYLKELEG